MDNSQLLCLTGLAALFAFAPAHGQMSVTTIGSTDAAQCYENANSESARDTEPCDAALRRGLSRADEKKTLVNRGILHNRRGDLAAAFKDFNAALAIDGDLAEAYINRGNAYLLSGRPDDAISDYERSLTLGVNRPWAAWYNIGLAYEAKKDKAKAREAYAKALEINPSFTLAATKLATLDAGPE